MRLPAPAPADSLPSPAHGGTGQGMAGKILINYRREDARADARNIRAASSTSILKAVELLP